MCFLSLEISLRAAAFSTPSPLMDSLVDQYNSKSLRLSSKTPIYVHVCMHLCIYSVYKLYMKCVFTNLALV